MSLSVFQNEFDVPFTVKAGQIGEFLVGFLPAVVHSATDRPIYMAAKHANTA